MRFAAVLAFAGVVFGSGIAAGPIPENTLTIHADRGWAMRSKTVAELLSDLRIGRTHSRPHVSND